MTAVAAAARATWRFLWDFLVGDTPELFVASLVLVGVAFLVAHDRDVAVVVVPLVAVAAVAVSAVRGRRHHGH